MSYLLGFIFIIAAILSLGKIDFTHFIMLCAISVGFNISGAIESIANAINKNKDDNTDTKNDK